MRCFLKGKTYTQSFKTTNKQAALAIQHGCVKRGELTTAGNAIQPFF